MDEQKAAILEFISLRPDWRARYADLKWGIVDVPRTDGVLRELGIEEVRMTHVRMIPTLREMVRDGVLVHESVRTPHRGRIERQYALPTDDLEVIRAWEWAPEHVIARLSGLDRRLSDEEHKLFTLALRKIMTKAPMVPQALRFIDGSIPPVPLEVRYRRLLNHTRDPTSLTAIRDEIYADERLREDETMVLAATANVLIRRCRGEASV